MIVDRLERSRVDGLCEISARVRHPRLEAQRLWFRFPAEFAPDRLDGSPFLAGVLIWAMRNAADIVVDAPVSSALLANLDKIIAILQSLSPADRRRIDVDVTPGLPSPPIATTGAFFTRGVDSWYAVLQALEDAPQDPPLSHLVFCPAAMAWPTSPEVRRWLLNAVKQAAAPMFLIQAENDYSLGPAEVLGAEINGKGGLNRTGVYPAYGGTRESGHAAFASLGMDVWGNDVCEFLDEVFTRSTHLRSERRSAPADPSE